MLFSRLQSQNKAPFSIGIHRLTHNTAGEFPHHIPRRRHKSQVRTAESHRKSQRLSFSHCDIGAAFGRRLKNRQGDGITACNHLAAGFVNQFRYGGYIFQNTVVIGLLYIETGHCLIKHPLQRLKIHAPVH